jgi:uncharacterized membrane-anchored protein
VHFHPIRDRLLAEVHARPPTPIAAPMLVTRIAALSGQDGVETDRRHMAELCQAIGAPAPPVDARWHAVEAGEWQLRWERHSEFSTWTFLRAPTGEPEANAAAAAPAEWLERLPGPVLVHTTIRIRRGHHGDAPALERHNAIGTRLLDGTATLHTDLKPDGQGMTRFHLVVHQDDPTLNGRLVLALLEIETYRLMALLAFPVATETAARLAEIEVEAGALAARTCEDLGVEDDRALLTRLVALSGEMEALSAATNFRFRAGRAYHEIVIGRTASLREEPLPGLQTIGEFMDRRLGPAMRTCVSVAEREREVIARVARAGQMLNTRIELVTQAINADLLKSMDRRASMQLRLQRTVEGLSVAAISYYVLQLLLYPVAALTPAGARISRELLTAALVPAVVLIVWLLLRRARNSFANETADGDAR